jgi:hypothetical protein
LLLRRIGLDPATSSAPFVATLVDVSGLIIYFMAGIILGGTLPSSESSENCAERLNLPAG